jgi:hypothetical protein
VDGLMLLLLLLLMLCIKRADHFAADRSHP